MQTKINPAGQPSTEEYEAELRATPAPILWPAEREKLERALTTALVISLMQSLAGYDRRDKVIELAKQAMRNALVPFTRAGG